MHVCVLLALVGKKSISVISCCFTNAAFNFELACMRPEEVLDVAACCIQSTSYYCYSCDPGAGVGLPSALQVFQGRLDSLAVATIKALTTVMLKSPAAKVIRTSLLRAGSGWTQNPASNRLLTPEQQLKVAANVQNNK